MRTLDDVLGAYERDVLDHLDRQATVPVVDTITPQGDLIAIPLGDRRADGAPVGAGVTVLAGAHPHDLVGEALWSPAPDGLRLGFATVTGEAYLIHPEHAATGLAPGCWELRRQREGSLAEQRQVAD